MSPWRSEMSWTLSGSYGFTMKTTVDAYGLIRDVTQSSIRKRPYFSPLTGRHAAI